MLQAAAVAGREAAPKLGVAAAASAAATAIVKAEEEECFRSIVAALAIAKASPRLAKEGTIKFDLGPVVVAIVYYVLFIDCY